MQAKNKDKNIILNSLRLIKVCPVCNTKYTQNTAKVVDKAEEYGILIHFSCPVCKTSLVVNMFELPFGLVGSAMVTDLQADEILKFKNSEKVTVDDVLEVYQELEVNNKR